MVVVCCVLKDGRGLRDEDDKEALVHFAYSSIHRPTTTQQVTREQMMIEFEYTTNTTEATVPGFKVRTDPRTRCVVVS